MPDFTSGMIMDPNCLRMLSANDTSRVGFKCALDYLFPIRLLIPNISDATETEKVQECFRRREIERQF